MKTQNKNVLGAVIIETIMTGFIPILSEILPRKGAIILEMKAIESPRFNSV